MDFDLNSDQKNYRDLAKNFSDKELKPFAAEWDKESFFPKETLNKAGELGFLSLYVDTNLGGMGLGRLDASIVFEQLAQGCTSTTAFMTIHNMAIWMVSKFASEELKEEWFPQLSSGQKLASYCLTEPGSGSDAASLRTTAKEDGDYFILNGSKAFISGSGATDCLVLMARTGDEGAKGISCFLIPADSPGIEYGKNEPKMGWKNQPTRLVSLTDVKVPKKNLIGEEGKGWTYAKYLLEFERGNGYSSELYQQLQQIKAKAEAEDASGAKLSEDLSFMESVAKLEVQINAMEATELRILGSLSAGQNVGPESSLLKTRGTEIGQAITELAVELVGYYGIPFNNPGPEIGNNEPAIGSRFANTAAPRYFNYRKASIYAGSNEIQRNIMAKLVLGLS